MFNQSTYARRWNGVRSLAAVLILACVVSVGAGCSCGAGKLPEPEMPRLLARLPVLADLADSEDGFVVSFSAPEMLKVQGGYKEDLMLENLPVSMIDGLLAAVGPAGVCGDLDAYYGIPRAEMDIGYDVMAVKRCIEAGGVTYLEGDFDQKQVAESLESLGYDADEYDGTVVYHFDDANYRGDEAGRELATAAGHVALLRKAVVIATTAERLRAALDVEKEQTDDLASIPEYVALAEVLGPTASAVFLSSGDRLLGVGYQDFSIRESDYDLQQPSRPSCTSPVNSERWQGVWSGGTELVRVRAVVLASVYATAREASLAAEGLVDRVEAHPYAEYWIWYGEPVVTESEGGAILTVTLELARDAPDDILDQLIAAWPLMQSPD